MLFATAYVTLADAQPAGIKKSSSAAGRQQEVNRATRLARQAESDGDLERALDLWQFVHDNKPGYFSAYHGIKRCLLGLNRYREALVFLDGELEKASRSAGILKPADIAADRIEVLYTAKEDSAAESELEKALVKYRGDKKIYRSVSGVLSLHGMYERSLEVLYRGREEINDPFLYAREIARWAENRMNWETAIREYLLYLEESNSRLSYVTGAIGDLSDQPAVDSIAHSVVSETLEETEGPFSITLNRLLAALYFRSQRYDIALEHYQELEALTGAGGHEMLGFAQSVAAEGEYPLALQAFNDVLSIGPKAKIKESALIGKGLLMEMTDNLDSAEISYKTVLELNSSSSAMFEAYSRLGFISIERSHPTEARKYFESAIKLARQARLSVNRIDVLYIEIARSWELDGNLERAEKVLRDLIRRSGRRFSEYGSARYELAKLYFRKGEIEAVEREIDALLLAYPASEYANECLQLQNLINDLKSSQDVIRAFGNADLLLLWKDTEEARSILDSLAESGSGPIREHALWRLFQIDFDIADYNRAHETLIKIIASPEYLRRDLALYRAGEVCTRYINKPQLAQVYYEEILISCPGSPMVDKARRHLKNLQQE